MSSHCNPASELQAHTAPSFAVQFDAGQRDVTFDDKVKRVQNYIARARELLIEYPYSHTEKFVDLALKCYNTGQFEALVKRLSEIEKQEGGSVRVWACLLVDAWGHTLYQTKSKQKTINHKASSALRLYFLARSLDPSGSGVVSPQALQEAAKELKIPKRTFAAWKSDAIRLGILQPVNEWTLRIVSQDRIFKLLKCQNIDKTTVIIPLKSLFSKGWRARVWAAYLKANNHDENPISQKKLNEITGVSIAAQKTTLHKYYKSKRQIGITSYPAEMVEMFNEYASPGKYFVFRDPQQGNRKVVAENLPSVKKVSDKTAKTAGRGRRIAILARLARYGLGCNPKNLSNSLQPNKTIARLFYSTPNTQGMSPQAASKKKANFERKVLRLTQSIGRLPQDPDRVFVKRGRFAAWDVYPLQDARLF